MIADLQSTLCDAVKSRNIVRLKYDDDFQFRTYAPYIVYRSSKNIVLVEGTQINNLEEPLVQNEPRQFELEKITALEVTDQKSPPPSDFNPLDKRYRYGIICVISPL